MEDATLIKNISSNFVRAKNAEQEADDKVEMRCLLFAARDIVTLLQKWNSPFNDGVDDITARTYVESMHYTTSRIREIVAARVER